MHQVNIIRVDFGKGHIDPKVGVFIGETHLCSVLENEVGSILDPLIEAGAVSSTTALIIKADEFDIKQGFQDLSAIDPFRASHKESPKEISVEHKVLDMIDGTISDTLFVDMIADYNNHTIKKLTDHYDNSGKKLLTAELPFNNDGVPLIRDGSPQNYILPYTQDAYYITTGPGMVRIKMNENGLQVDILNQLDLKNITMGTLEVPWEDFTYPS